MAARQQPLTRYTPGREPAAPSGARSRYLANIAAIRVLREVEDSERAADAAEQQILARWSGWGAVTEVFDTSRTDWESERATLRELLTEAEYTQARRTTLNAHYTHPAYVQSIWATLGALGFAGGNVLEPGSGNGAFIGAAPPTAHVTGVELDDTTARISRLLYPDATVRSESFADTRIPAGTFDATIGNVPFADLVLHDPIDNANRHALHNHFILKSLRLTRPGGIVAVLTSRFTLDAANPAARREMNQYADLVGAIRLPSGAHRRTAGTEAVTDLLILRRREPGQPPADLTWEGVSARTVDNATVKINSYFDLRPQNILGTLHVGNGMYGSETLSVVAPDLADIATQLTLRLNDVVDDARHRGLTMTPRTYPAPTAVDSVERDAWDGSIHAQPDGTFAVSTRAGREPLAVPKSAANELRSMLQLRDLATEQLAAERAQLDDTDRIRHTREQLHRAWRRHVATYGALNRYTPTATGRVDEHGEPILARRVPTAARLLRDDPFGPLVFALEVFDDDTQHAEPAAILHQRVVLPRPERLGADTPAEALQLSLNQRGSANLDYMAGLLGDTTTSTRERLGTLVYDDPETGELIPAAAYLSGSIAGKIDAAQIAAEVNPKYRVNLDALRDALPTPLTPEDIAAKAGAVWISPAVHQQFLRELVRDDTVTVSCPLPTDWKVRGGMRRTVLATSEWGTARRSAHEIFERMLRQDEMRVIDEIEEGDTIRRVVNPTESAAMQEKADLIAERFEEWIWEDPDRARHLADEYNRRFNSIVLRDYSAEGDSLTFPGMTATFSLRPHQKAAVARILNEPAVGLFHEVGAGKTAEMIAGAMELRRLGMAGKVGVVVPNHMLEQFTREWLQIYPEARLLAASTDTLAGDKRRLFVARAAANEWDAVILTQEAFKRLPVEPATQGRYIDREITLLEQALSDPELDRLSVKQIEKQLAAAQEKQRRLLDVDRDPGITFEATGIDYLMVDEFHTYKNLDTISRIPDARIDGSLRSTDMAMKLAYLRDRHGARVVTVATATPIANSITEAHVMQRYLRPDLLREAGVEAFDAWAATFGVTTSEMEMAPQGGSFRLKTRFARFQNVPEMLRMWHVFADVKTAEDLNLPTPELKTRADGQRAPHTVAIAAPSVVLDYVERLGERAEAVANRSVTPDVDNMLKISTDGRKAALDYRMIDPDAQPEDPPALETIADTIARIHHQNKDNRYQDTRTGEPSPVPGALQLVFLDLGTPKDDQWNAYDELKLLLTARGVPEGSIRYIHEAKNDKQKASIFSAAREGRIAVLMGSTTRMGVGTNVQARAVALHDVDCPWRPADVAQRHGRILRQLNQNSEVEIYQYVVTGTFAAYMWQTIERKARFISQVMRGRLDVREIEDLPSDVLSAAEAKALASGNPLLLERSVALNEVGRLERLERAWHRNQTTVHATAKGLERRIEQLQANISAYQEALGRVHDLSGDRFHMTITQRACTTRTAAAASLAQWARNTGIQYARPHEERARGQVGEISGFTVTARTRSVLGNPVVVFQFEGIPETEVRVPTEHVLDGDGVGVIRQIENRLSSLPDRISKAQLELQEHQRSLEDAQRSLTTPFKHTEQLGAARAALAAVDAQLAIPAALPEPAPAPHRPEHTAYPQTGPHSPGPGDTGPSWNR